MPRSKHHLLKHAMMTGTHIKSIAVRVSQLLQYLTSKTFSPGRNIRLAGFGVELV